MRNVWAAHTHCACSKNSGTLEGRSVLSVDPGTRARRESAPLAINLKRQHARPGPKPLKVRPVPPHVGNDIICRRGPCRDLPGVSACRARAASSSCPRAAAPPPLRPSQRRSLARFRGWTRRWAFMALHVEREHVDAPRVAQRVHRREQLRKRRARHLQAHLAGGPDRGAHPRLALDDGGAVARADGRLPLGRVRARRAQQSRPKHRVRLNERAAPPEAFLEKEGRRVRYPVVGAGFHKGALAEQRQPLPREEKGAEEHTLSSPREVGLQGSGASRGRAYE